MNRIASLPRYILPLLGGLAVLSGAGALYQALAMSSDERCNPPPGRLVDVQGHRMRLVCAGEGQPAVVFEHGLSGSATDWSSVLPAIASFTRACAYDRAGCGWSEPGPRPRTSQRIAAELYDLLHAAGIPGPYVLVGHSFGGMNVRVYAKRYPDEVAGIVLVDAAVEGQRERFPRPSLPDELRWWGMHLYPIWTRLGVMRLLRRPNGIIDVVPPQAQPLACAAGLRSTAYDWIVTEAATLTASEEQARRTGSLGSMPLAVISSHPRAAPAGVSLEQADRIWQELQGKLAALSTSSRRIIVEESGHFIQLDQPELVVAAIRSIVDAVHKAPGGTGPRAGRSSADG